MFTLSLEIACENWNFNFSIPKFISVYINSIHGFIDNPIDIPILVLSLFIVGGVCTGITLGINMHKSFKSLTLSGSCGRTRLKKTNQHFNKIHNKITDS